MKEAPFVNGHYQLKIGVRYTAAVRINSGLGPPYETAGVVVNPDLHVPASLNVVNPVGSTFWPIEPDSYPGGHQTRRFALTCSEWGSYPLGFNR